jgi:predicted transcriptional regulator
MPEPTAKLNAYIETVQTGKAEKAIKLILHHLKKEGFSTIFEIGQVTKIKHSTITARLNTLLSAGVVFKTGKYKPQGAKRNYTAYCYVESKEKRQFYGKLFQLEMAKNKLRSIVEDNIYSHATQAAAKHELERMGIYIEHYKTMVQ